ncbi:MAG: hypothetical protein CSA74_12695 [Rhodobacterales bacterium]|nr:MAG: hypothetical protein CSA74_12695 [Rhodobacterales bacterium]
MPDLTSNCPACAALCCMALAFDAGPDFAFDKPAGLPCPNLTPDFGCQHFTHLEAAGFPGCVRYECKGAGQRVTQELFEGANWRDVPSLTRPMIAAFAAMRTVHEGLELLEAAARLGLPPSLEQERETLLEAYLPPAWTEASLAAFAASDTPAALRAFLPKLRDWV